MLMQKAETTMQLSCGAACVASLPNSCRFKLKCRIYNNYAKRCKQEHTMKTLAMVQQTE